MNSNSVNIQMTIECAAPARMVIQPGMRELETPGAGALSDFNKECLEKIPPAELRAIHDKALRIIDLARLSPAGPLPLAYCDKCPGEGKFRLKQPCFAFVETRESLCAYHAMEKLERELCREYLDAHRPKLDLADFARL